MSPALLVVPGAILVILFWGMGAFNALVRSRNSCDESWADIDTELRRRYDLIPNLVETVKAYARHERELLERVTAARTAALASHGSISAQARDENALGDNVRQLLAVAEGYPELKADKNFLDLQEELAHTEDRLQRARRFYNANVRDLANRIETFPSNLVAGWFHFRPREYFELAESAAREVPSVRI